MHQLQARAVKHSTVMTYVAVAVCCCTCTSHWDLQGLRVCGMLGTVVRGQMSDVFITMLQPGTRLHIGNL